jgi:hypothetical protein
MIVACHLVGERQRRGSKIRVSAPKDCSRRAASSVASREKERSRKLP